MCSLDEGNPLSKSPGVPWFFGGAFYDHKPVSLQQLQPLQKGSVIFQELLPHRHR